MSLIRKHGAVLQAWACLDLVANCDVHIHNSSSDLFGSRCYLQLN